MKNLIEGKQSMSVFKDTRTLAAKVVEMVDAIMKGQEPPINDTKTYDNGTGIIPSFLCEPVSCTVDNYKELLIDSGYYTYDQLGVEGEEAAAPAEPAGGQLVGVAMPTKDLQRWNQDGENMKAMLEAAGYEVDLQYGANDIATQVSQIENMIANGCKVLVIASIDGDSLGTVLAQAKEAGIPVIAYDRLIMNSDAVTYYATFDNWLVGTKQGEFIRDALDLDNAEGPFNIEFITSPSLPPPTGRPTPPRPASRTSWRPTTPTALRCMRFWPPTTPPPWALRTRWPPPTATTSTRSSPVRTATSPS